MVVKKNVLLDSLGLLIALSFLIFTAKPLFHAGLFPTVDNYAVVRIEEMGKELKNGQFPVRHIADLSKGHGYMFFNYISPLPYYVGAILNHSGINIVGALKRTYLIPFIIGVVFMFLLGRKYFGRVGGIVTSGFFSLSPFLGFDTYYRGGLGEVWAMCILPMVIYFSINYIEKYSVLGLISSSLSIALLVLSHNVTSYISLPVIIFFLFMLSKSKLNIRLLFPFIVGLSVSSFFWLPAFFEKNLIWGSYMNQNTTNAILNFLQYRMLYSPSFLFKLDYLNPWYGLLPFVILLILIYKKAKIDKIIILSMIIITMSLFLTMPLSKPVWEHLMGVLSMLQFPWRFLTLYTVFSPLIIGSIFLYSKKYSIPLAIIVLLITFITSVNAFKPERYEFIDKYRPEDSCGTTFQYEYLPIWTKVCLKQFPNTKFDFFEGQGQIQTIKNHPRDYELTVKTQENSIVRVNEYYFPGWKVYVDGNNVQINYRNLYGIISFPLKKGEHNVKIKFENTPLRNFSNILSLISFISITILGGYSLVKIILIKNKRKSNK